MNNEKRRRALELMKKYYGGIVESESKIVPPELETVSISGTILNFNTDISRPLENLILHLEPTQSGSGDPSPSNIRPITGYDSVSVMRAGKNLLPYPFSDTTKTVAGITFTDLGDGKLKVNGTATARAVFFFARNAFKPIPSGEYILSRGATVSDVVLSIDAYQGNKWVKNINGSKLTESQFSIDYDGYDRLDIFVSISAGQTVSNDILSLMIRLATETDATFTHYSGQTYDITFPSEAGTVYGGKLDVTTGVLTVDRAMADLGTLNWNYFVRNTRFAVKLNNGKFTGLGIGLNTALCECYTIVTMNYNAMSDKSISVGSNFLGNSTCSLVIHDEAYTTADELKTALSGRHIVYELANPITFQLTPTEVTTLFGDNTIWMDAKGTIDAEYWRIKQ